MKFKSKKLTALAMAVLMAASTMSSAVFAEDVGVPTALEAAEDAEVVVSDEAAAPTEEVATPVTVEEAVPVAEISAPQTIATGEGKDAQYVEGSMDFTYDEQGNLTKATYKVAPWDPVAKEFVTDETKFETREATDLKVEVVIPANCTTDKVVIMSAAILTGERKESENITLKGTATGHEFVETNRRTVKNPSCLDDGLAYVEWKCAHDGCDKDYDDGMTDDEVKAEKLQNPITLPATGHDFSGDKVLYPDSDMTYADANIKNTTEKNEGTPGYTDKWVEENPWIGGYGKGGKADAALDGPQLVEPNKDGHYEYRVYCSHDADPDDPSKGKCDVYKIVGADDVYATEGYIAVVTKRNNAVPAATVDGCNIQVTDDVGSKDATKNKDIELYHQFKWNLLPIEVAKETRTYTLSAEDAAKIELANCTKDGYFEVSYYNAYEMEKENWIEGNPPTAQPITTVRYKVPAHHMEESPVVEFKTEKDAEQCTVKYNADGTITVTNKSCIGDVTYYEVTHCTAAGCPNGDCDNAPKNSDNTAYLHDLAFGLSASPAAENVGDTHKPAACESTGSVNGVHQFVKAEAKTAKASANHHWNTEVEWVVAQINAGVKTADKIADAFNTKFGYLPTGYTASAASVATINELDDKAALDAAMKEAKEKNDAYAVFAAKIDFLNAVKNMPKNKITIDSKNPLECITLVYDPAATCTTKGSITVQYRCIICGKADVKEPTDKIVEPEKGHLIDPNKSRQAEYVAPTCQSTGKLVTQVVCDREGCGEVFLTRETVVPRTAHSNESVDAREMPLTNPPTPDVNNVNNNDVLLKWVGDKVIDPAGTDNNLNIWKYFETNGKKAFTLATVIGNKPMATSEVYVGDNVAGFRVKVQGYTICKYCDEYTVDLNDTAYTGTNGKVTITVKSVEKEAAQCKPGSITLSAVYEKGTYKKELGEKTFEYYSSREAYNGRNDHDWYIVGTVVEKAPTETETGLEVTTRKCRVCGTEERLERVLDKLQPAEPEKPVERLPQVTGLTATLVKPGRVELKWNKVEGAVAYIILGSNAYRTGSQIAYVAGRESWTDTSADTDGTNAYWVLAVSKDDEGNIVRGQLDSKAYVWTWGRTVGAMGQVTATAVANGINVTWNAVSDANAYVVKAYVKGTGLRDCGSTTATSFVDEAAQVDVVTVYFVYPVYKSGSKTVAIGTPNAFTTSCGAKRKAA